MDKELIKSLIKEQAEEVKEKNRKEHIINRDISLDRYLNSNVALFILGVRRCGKSTLALQLFADRRFGYINFDDERLLGVTSKDLNTIVQAFYELYGNDLDSMIFDEIQNAKGWELFVSRLRESKRIIVTGSNSKLLSGELSTYLTGRHIDATIFPFSFREFLRYKGIEVSSTLTTGERAQLNSLLAEYLENGGFPEFFKYGSMILSSIYNDIITKDIIQRHKIKHIEAFRQIARYMISNTGGEFTYSSLRSLTPVKNAITIKGWAGYMQEAYLLFFIERFSFKLKNMAMAPKKVYAIDTGIANLLGYRSDQNIARLMETTVAVELKRRQAKGLVKEVYYWKDYQQREVDFVIKEGNKVIELIQVTYASSREEVKEREIGSILAASKELHCDRLKIITTDYEGSEMVEGKRIGFVPLWKWLLL
jgi:predicted AAA+ superfamily ATPase